MPPPQTPPLQTFEQHWVGLKQGVPFDWHMPGPQMPFVQKPAQQGGPPGGAQGKPFCRHIPLPQIPFVQAPEQQGPPGALHGTPLGLHPPIPQTPFVQRPEQHCEGDPQGVMSGWQTPQVKPHFACACMMQPGSHCVWQQCGSVWQTNEVHIEQLKFSGGPGTHGSWQLPELQTPPAHWPLQQSSGVMQNFPSGAQCGPH